LAVVVAVELVASAAIAQPAEPASAAQALFKEAAAKLDARDYAAACPMLERVLEIEPRATGARLALGECYEGLGRLGSAARAFDRAAAAAAAAGQRERQQKAANQAARLHRQAGAIIVQVAPSIRARPELKVTVCGDEVPAASWGAPWPVDKGTCAVVARAGADAWDRTERVVDGATVSVVLGPPVELAPPPAARPVVVVDAPRGAPPHAPTLSHAGQLGAFARVDVDLLSGGALTALGASYAPVGPLEIAVSGLVGKRGGFEGDATVYFLDGAWKPLVLVGVPVIFEGAPYAGVRPSAGVEWDVNRHLGFFATGGATLFPTAPPGYAHAAVLAALGVQGRL
jgi:hypothetical protein